MYILETCVALIILVELFLLLRNGRLLYDYTEFFSHRHRLFDKVAEEISRGVFEGGFSYERITRLTELRKEIVFSKLKMMMEEEPLEKERYSWAYLLLLYSKMIEGFRQNPMYLNVGRIPVNVINLKHNLHVNYLVLLQDYHNNHRRISFKGNVLCYVGFSKVFKRMIDIILGNQLSQVELNGPKDYELLDRLNLIIHRKISKQYYLHVWVEYLFKFCSKIFAIFPLRLSRRNVSVGCQGEMPLQPCQGEIDFAGSGPHSPSDNNMPQQTPQPADEEIPEVPPTLQEQDVFENIF